MPWDLAPRRPGSAPFRLALRLVVVAVVTLAALEVVLLLARPAASGAVVIVLVMFPAVALIYLAAGAVAWSRRPANRLGALMIVGALTWIGAGLLNVRIPAVAAVGLITATVPLAVVLHLLLGFPSGRLRSRADRVTVAAIYVATLVLQAPVYLFGQGLGGPSPGLLVADRPDLAEIGGWVQDGIAAVAAASTIVLLLRRHRAASADQRSVLGPLYVYGMFVWLFVPVSARVVPPLFGDVATAVAQLVVVGAVPIVFATAVRRGGFGRTGDLDEVSAWLAVRTGGMPELARALAQALGDPSVRLVLGGQAEPGSGRATYPVRLAGRRVGAVEYDATLIGDPSFVGSAARMAAVALDHERLTTELTASRARIAHSADDERRRIARDLHDGLQGRLVVLGLEASMISTDLALPAAGRDAVAQLRDGLEVAVRELGALVQGLLPAALVERGLAAAVEDLADRMPVSTVIELDLNAAAAPTPAAELTAYYIVAEALANAVKHAQARTLQVRLRQDDGWLHAEVRDDGVGGARPAGGLGLRGMADRVDVLGGRLRIDSPAGGGTLVVAEVPCGP